MKKTITVPRHKLPLPATPDPRPVSPRIATRVVCRDPAAPYSTVVEHFVPWDGFNYLLPSEMVWGLGDEYYKPKRQPLEVHRIETHEDVVVAMADDERQDEIDGILDRLERDKTPMGDEDDFQLSQPVCGSTLEL